MRYNLTHFFVLIFFLISSSISSSEMTLNELFFDNSKPYNLKIIEALPEKAIIQIGPDDAKNTVLETFSFFCFYFMKVNTEKDVEHQKCESKITYFIDYFDPTQILSRHI